MLSVKSGEIGTPKGKEKERALRAIQTVLENTSILSFRDYISY